MGCRGDYQLAFLKKMQCHLLAHLHDIFAAYRSFDRNLDTSVLI
jgi:hypothetical protein